MKIALALLLLPVAAAQPVDSPDFGFFLEPDPPALEPPSLDSEALGVVTTILIQGTQAGDVVAAPVGQGIVTVTESTGNLSVEAVTGNTLTQFSVERVAGDYKVLLTPWSVAIDQGVPESVNGYNLDAQSFTAWTAAHDFGGLEVGNVLAPEGVATTITQQSYLLQSIPLIHGLVMDFDSVIETDVEAGLQSAIDAAAEAATKTEIEDALNAVAITSLDLASLLQQLEDDPTRLAVLDAPSLADKLDQMQYKVKSVTYTGDPRTVLKDGVLSFVNGGKGPLAFLPGSTLNVDDDQATAVKQATSKLSIWSLTESTQTFLSVHPDLGSYSSLHRNLAKFQAVGVPLHVSKDLKDCPAGAMCTAAAKTQEPGVQELLALGGLAAHAPQRPTGVRGGDLKAMPPLDFTTTRFVAADQVQWPQAGTAALPHGGVGSATGVALPQGISRPALPQTGGFQPTLPDAVLEHWSAPGLPGVQPIVPVAGNVVALMSNGAGSLVTMVPATGAVPGMEKTLTLRFVEGLTSLKGPLGISGVAATVITEDPLGVQTITVTKTSDAQGYAGPYTMPLVGSWLVRATHEDYHGVEGGGSMSPARAQEGQEYTMESSDASVLGVARSHSLVILAVVVAGVAAFWIWRHYA